MKNSLLGDQKRGRVFILSAPAGTGKTTLVRMLTQEFPCVVASVSYTTRPPRPGEIEGIHYHFISDEEFRERMAAGEFLENVQLYGFYYGTSRAALEAQLSRGKHVILVIDTQGALALKGKVDAPLIFVAPPSMEELEKRLLSRKTEPEEVIARRLSWAQEEMLRKSHYDYCVVNDDLLTAYQVLRSILIAEEHRVRYNSAN